MGVLGHDKVEGLNGYTPYPSSRFAREVLVGHLNHAVAKDTLVDYVMRRPPDNDTNEYNCHHWVSEVLVKFERDGYISQTMRLESVDRMLEATSEAVDG